MTNNILPQKKTIGEMSLDAKIIYELLSKIEIGETVTYDQINKAITRNIRVKPQALYSAFSMAKRLDSAVFSCVQNVGYRRLNDNEIIAETSQYTTVRTRNLANRAVKNYNCVNQNNLSSEMQSKLNVNFSLACTLKQLSTPKIINEIERKPTPSLIPINDVLNLFRVV